MIHRAKAGLLAALLALAAAPASAEPPACGAKLLGSIAVATANNVPLVTLSANGRPVTMILDTGAERTTLTPDAARRIGAQPPRIAFDSRLNGIGGSLATREMELTGFAAGAVDLPWRRVLVAPVAISRASATTTLDGLLGADVLSDFDLEIDLPRRRLSFHARQTCPDAEPDWAAPPAAIAAGRSPADHLFFPARLDGRRVVALIDTGAQRTVLAASFARAAGLGDAALGRDRSVTANGAAGEQLVSRVHRFARLDVGGEAVPNPELVVADVSLRDADLVIGMDVLISRRLWLSYGAQRIFLSSR